MPSFAPPSRSVGPGLAGPGSLTVPDYYQNLLRETEKSYKKLYDPKAYESYENDSKTNDSLSDIYPGPGNDYNLSNYDYINDSLDFKNSQNTTGNKNITPRTTKSNSNLLSNLNQAQNNSASKSTTASSNDYNQPPTVATSSSSKMSQEDAYRLLEAAMDGQDDEDDDDDMDNDDDLIDDYKDDDGGCHEFIKGSNLKNVKNHMDVGIPIISTDDQDDEELRAYLQKVDREIEESEELERKLDRDLRRDLGSESEGEEEEDHSRDSSESEQEEEGEKDNLDSEEKELERLLEEETEKLKIAEARANQAREAALSAIRKKQNEEESDDDDDDEGEDNDNHVPAPYPSLESQYESEKDYHDNDINSSRSSPEDPLLEAQSQDQVPAFLSTSNLFNLDSLSHDPELQLAVESSLKIMKAGAPLIMTSKTSSDSDSLIDSDPSLCYFALTDDEEAIVYSTNNFGTDTDTDADSSDADGDIEESGANRILIKDIADVDVVEDESFLGSSDENDDKNNTSTLSYCLRITIRDTTSSQKSSAESITLTFATSEDFSGWYEGLLYVCEKANRKEAEHASEMAERIRLENLEMRKILLEQQNLNLQTKSQSKNIIIKNLQKSSPEEKMQELEELGAKVLGRSQFLDKSLKQLQEEQRKSESESKELPLKKDSSDENTVVSDEVDRILERIRGKSKEKPDYKFESAASNNRLSTTTTKTAADYEFNVDPENEISATIKFPKQSYQHKDEEEEDDDQDDNGAAFSYQQQLKQDLQRVYEEMRLAKIKSSNSNSFNNKFNYNSSDLLSDESDLMESKFDQDIERQARLEFEQDVMKKAQELEETEFSQEESDILADKRLLDEKLMEDYELHFGKKYEKEFREFYEKQQQQDHNANLNELRFKDMEDISESYEYEQNYGLGFETKKDAGKTPCAPKSTISKGSTGTTVSTTATNLSTSFKKMNQNQNNDNNVDMSSDISSDSEEEEDEEKDSEEVEPENDINDDDDDDAEFYSKVNSAMNDPATLRKLLEKEQREVRRLEQELEAEGIQIPLDDEISESNLVNNSSEYYQDSELLNTYEENDKESEDSDDSESYDNIVNDTSLSGDIAHELDILKSLKQGDLDADKDLTHTTNEDEDEDSSDVDDDDKTESESDEDDEEEEAYTNSKYKLKNNASTKSGTKFQSESSKSTKSNLNTLLKPGSIAKFGPKDNNNIKSESESTLPHDFPSNEEELQRYLDYLKSQTKVGKEVIEKGRDKTQQNITTSTSNYVNDLGNLKGGYIPLDFQKQVQEKLDESQYDHFKMGGEYLGGRTLESDEEEEDESVTDLQEKYWADYSLPTKSSTNFSQLSKPDPSKVKVLSASKSSSKSSESDSSDTGLQSDSLDQAPAPLNFQSESELDAWIDSKFKQCQKLEDNGDDKFNDLDIDHDDHEPLNDSDLSLPIESYKVQDNDDQIIDQNEINNNNNSSSTIEIPPHLQEEMAQVLEKLERLGKTQQGTPARRHLMEVSANYEERKKEVFRIAEEAKEMVI